MCPIGHGRKRRTIDYELDDLYDAEHDYSTDDLSDDFIEDHYEELEERRMNKTANRDTRPEKSDFIGSMRVLNGETGTLPFFVAIRTSTNIHFCGGALYNEDTVITAAHCFGDRGTRASQYRVTMGHEKRKWRDARREPNFQEFRVREIILHRGYDNRDFENDIAIMKLRSPAEFTDYVRPICMLPPGYSLPSSTNAIVGGWGKNEGDEFSQVFKFATAHVFSSAECNRFAGAGYTRNDGTQFCIGYEQGGIDTCQGDSGGPAIVKIDGAWTLIGVVSFGDGCGKSNKPGVFTNIAHRSISGFLQNNL